MATPSLQATGELINTLLSRKILDKDINIIDMPECDKEAIRLLTNGPTWSPGTQRGNTVYMMQIQSIEFNSKRYKKMQDI